MKMFEVSFVGLMWRYYLLMMVVIVAGFSGMWWLALLGLPIVLSCLTGVSFKKSPKQSQAKMATRIQKTEASQSAA